jgi:hypothetical protein
MSRASEHTHLQRIINLILLLAGNVWTPANQKTNL